MVMETPSAQCVGREFVRQYYTLLHEAPDHLHRFYSHNSSFVHGGVEKPGEEQPPVMGQQEIHKKILALNFCDCHAKIRQVDSQATLGNGVVVQVTGELSNNGLAMRRFMQTFVLAPQSPKKYYVHNDIFRYQDEVFHDAENDVQEESGGSDIENLESETEVQLDTVMDPTVSSFFEQHVPHLNLSNGNSHLEEIIDSEPVIPVHAEEEKPPPEKTDFEEVEDKEAESSEPHISAESQEIQDDCVESTDNKTFYSQKVEFMSGWESSNKPFSWAAITSKNTGQPGAVPAVTSQTAVVKPQPPAPKPEVKSEFTSSPPQPQRIPRSGKIDRPRERESSRGAVEDDNRRNSRYPDTQQLFVGNLPHSITEKELKTYFESYGKVAEVRINKKILTSREVPNFGFVVFEDPETVTQVLESKPILLHGEHRLNVEEKKQRGEQMGRPGSGTRTSNRGVPVSGSGMSRGVLSGGRGTGRGVGPPRTDNKAGSNSGMGSRGGYGQGPRR